MTALAATDVVGVYGEPEVGTSSVVANALSQSDLQVVRLDLDGVAGTGDIAWQIAEGVARLLVPATELSILRGPRSLAPTSAREALVQVQRTIGAEFANLAIAPTPPSAGIEPVKAFELLGRLAVDRPLLLWIDHLESPSLTPRHPVRIQELLWSLRAVQQHSPLKVVLSCVGAAAGLATDPDGAFHGDGEWIEMQRPPFGTWTSVAAELAEHTDATPPDGRWLDDFWHSCEAHPGTVLLGLCIRFVLPHSLSGAPELFRFLVGQDDGLAARGTLHARTLHRLGGRILSQIADGVGPYEASGGAAIQDIHRAVRRLHLSGLITQPAPRRWAITNPLLGVRLRGWVDAAGHRTPFLAPGLRPISE